MTDAGHWLDLDAWSRRAHFAFFSAHDVPWFNLCTWVPAGPTWTACRDGEASFALAAWYAVQSAANEETAFRYRLRDGRVWVHDRIRIATTIMDADETFRFVHFPWADDFSAFAAGAREAIATPGADGLDDRPHDDALVHGSTVPWIAFTSLTHARRRLATSDADSIPRVVLGKVHEAEGQWRLPISVEVHHALVDGLHIGRFLERLAQRLAEPEAWLR